MNLKPPFMMMHKNNELSYWAIPSIHGIQSMQDQYDVNEAINTDVNNLNNII